jgi:hypothetical protein
MLLFIEPTKVLNGRFCYIEIHYISLYNNIENTLQLIIICLKLSAKISQTISIQYTILRYTHNNSVNVEVFSYRL